MSGTSFPPGAVSVPLSQIAQQIIRLLGPNDIARLPTSPILVAPGGAWFNAFRQQFFGVPEWSLLPTTEPADADQFFLLGNEIRIPSNSTFLPRDPTGLGLGGIWNDGGIVIANGNPGLPTSSLIPGLLIYIGGPIALS